jgi:tetrahydromethanopterin S-methyltransferase subunit F
LYVRSLKIMGMETRIAALEVKVERIGKALDDLRYRVDNGFRELRAEIRDVRDEAKLGNRDLRKDVDARFRWIVGIQIATLLAVLGVPARVANL